MSLYINVTFTYDGRIVEIGHARDLRTPDGERAWLLIDGVGYDLDHVSDIQITVHRKESATS